MLKMLRSSGDDARHPRSWQKHRQLRWLSVLSLAVMVSTVAFALPSEPPQDVARVSRPMTVRDATDLSRKIYNMEDSQALDFLERWFQGQQDLGGLRRMTPRVRESLRMVMNTIIKAAGSEGKLSQSYTWYQRMREAKIDTNPRTFGKLVTAAAQAGHVEDAELWLDSMVEEGFKPDLVTISSVITACCEAKEPLRAERWFQLLLQQGLTPDLIAYNSMIDAHAEAGDGEKAAAWLQKAVDAGIDVSTACYNAVIKAYCRQGDLEGANAWLEKAKAAGRGLDIMSYNTVLNYFAEEGDLQKAQDWFGKLKASGLQLDQVSFNTMIKAAVAADKLPQTEEYIQEMLSNRLQPTAATYVSLVSAYGDQGDLETAQLWYDKAARVNKTNKIIDTSLAKAHVKAKDAQGAERGLRSFGAPKDGMELNNAVHYTTMMNAYAERGDVEGASSWFRRAREQPQVRLNIWAYNAMIKACGNAQDLERAQQWFNIAQQDGVKPDVVSYTLMITACGKVGRVGEARRWLERMEGTGVKPNVRSYTEAIKAGAQSHTSKSPGLREYQLFARMLSEGVWPTVLTYNFLLKSMVRSKPRMERQAEDVFRHMSQCNVKPNKYTQLYLARVVGLHKAKALCKELGYKVEID